MKQICHLWSKSNYTVKYKLRKLITNFYYFPDHFLSSWFLEVGCVLKKGKQLLLCRCVSGLGFRSLVTAARNWAFSAKELYYLEYVLNKPLSDTVNRKR